ncbi:LolA family protein [Acinetobacter puyangensis]|nr:outer membrane lipoprotein carrier protein LolA [Acinetobacter puyangensis]
MMISSQSFANPQQAQQIFQQLASQTLVRAQFQQQKQLPSVAKTFNSTGQVLFSKTNGVLWQMKTPVQADLVMTEKKLVQKTARTQSEVALDKSPYGAVASVFLQLMTGDQKTLSQNFNIQSIYIDDTQQPARWNIRLTPKSSLLKKLFIAVDASGAQYVENMLIQEKGNSTTRIQFRQHSSTPAQLSPAEHALFQLAK